jgi:uncharacterized membrane protein
VWKALILLYGIWGLNWIVMKEAVHYFPPVTFVAYRFALGAVILLAVTIWLKLPVPPRKYWGWIIVTGILQTALNNVLVQIGMQSLSAGLVAVLNYSMPVWVTIMAHFFLQEKMTLRKACRNCRQYRRSFCPDECRERRSYRSRSGGPRRCRLLGRCQYYDEAAGPGHHPVRKKRKNAV